MVTPKNIEPKRPARVYDTIPKLVRRNYDRWAIETALCKKKYGIWQKYSWRKYYEIVRQLSLGFISLGLQHGDVVCLLGDNEPEWLWSEFAAQTAGGIAAGIPAESTAEQAQSIVRQSGAKFAFVTDYKQAEKFLTGTPEIPAVQKIIYLNPKGLKDYDDPRLIGFNALLKLGEDYGKANAGVFEQNINSGRSDDTAFIFYTLDVKGQPKGAVMTHKALISSAEGLQLRFPVQPEDHLMASLPAASAENSLFATMPHLLTGATLNYPENTETSAPDTRETGPDFVACSAGQWENLAAEIKSQVSGSNPIARFFYKTLLPTGNKVASLKIRSRKPNIFQRLWDLPVDWIRSPLKDKTGLSRTRFAVSFGGTAPAMETLLLMHTLGVEIRQTFAIAETGLIASQSLEENDFKTAGRPTMNSEIRILKNGEMLVRSTAMFSGYYKDPVKTGQVLIDGWYYTGIPAQIDEKGQLILTDKAAAKTEGT